MSFVLRLPDNNSLVPSHKTIESRGSSKSAQSGSFGVQGDGTKSWDIANIALHSTGLISGIRFVPIDSVTDTSAFGTIRQGARVLVYGYEGLS